MRYFKSNSNCSLFSMVKCLVKTRRILYHLILYNYDSRNNTSAKTKFSKKLQREMYIFRIIKIN